MAERFYTHKGREYRIEGSNGKARMEPVTPQVDDVFEHVLMEVKEIQHVQRAFGNHRHVKSCILLKAFPPEAFPPDSPAHESADSWEEAAQRGASMLQTKKPEPNPLVRGLDDFLKGDDTDE